MNESYFDGPLLVSRLALIISCAKILTIDGLDNFQRSSKLLALQHFVKALLKAKGSAAVLGLVSDITAARLHAPSFCRVFELKLENVLQFRLQLRLENWKRDFDAPVEVSRHPVRGRRAKRLDFHHYENRRFAHAR